MIQVHLVGHFIFIIITSAPPDHQVVDPRDWGTLYYGTPVL